MVSPTLMPSLATSIGIARADIDADRVFGVGLLRFVIRPLEIVGVPAERQLDDGVQIAFGSVHQRGMALKITEGAAAAPFDFEAAIVRDRFHGETDFVHVSDNQNAGSLGSGGGRRAQMEDQISRRRRFRFWPIPATSDLYRFQNWRFVVAYAIGLGQFS